MKTYSLYENFLEFRQHIYFWNVLIVLGYWKTTLLQSSFPVNLDSFYVKIGEPLTKKSKFSTVSRRLSSLKLFSQEKFWIEGFILLHYC